MIFRQGRPRYYAAFILAVLVTSAAKAQDEPYAFRGIKLGITADEFRRVPHPDPGNPRDPILVVCTGDKLPKGFDLPPRVLLSPEEKKAGIERCGYFEQSRVFPTFTLRTLGLGDYGDSVFEFFRRSDKDPPRLSTIIVTIPEKTFGEISAAYVEKYGRPTVEHLGEVQNYLGVRLPNKILGWRNAVSTIFFQQRGEQLTISTVTYFHLELSAAAAERLKQVKGRLSDQL